MCLFLLVSKVCLWFVIVTSHSDISAIVVSIQAFPDLTSEKLLSPMVASAGGAYVVVDSLIVVTSYCL